MNCTCCKYNQIAQVKQKTIDTINEQLQENNIPRKVDRYWICQKRKGAFPKVLEQTLSDRNKFLILLKEAKDKPDCDLKLIEEYQTHQLGAKLFDNAGLYIYCFISGENSGTLLNLKIDHRIFRSYGKCCLSE